MEEEINTHCFNSDLPSPSAGVGKLCKEPSRKFFVENIGIEDTAETYKAPVNEFWKHSDSENYSPISADKQIKLIMAKIKQKIRARLNLKIFQKLDESMTSICCILNELHTKLKKQRIDANNNCSSGLKRVERICKVNIGEYLFNGSEEAVYRPQQTCYILVDAFAFKIQSGIKEEIEFAMQEQTDMQRQKFKDLQSDLLQIKSMMKTMATVKYKTCSCFSSEKECTKYKSMNDSSKQQIHNKNRKISGQEGEDVSDNEFLEGFLCSSSSPVQSCRMNENLVVISENKINSLQQSHEAMKPWNAKLTNNAETAMTCMHCNGGTNVLDMPYNACPPKICKQNIFFVNKKENASHLSVEEQNSKKCKDLRNNGSISNFQLPQPGRGSLNGINCNKEKRQYNGLELSSSAEHCNRCDIIEPSHAYECMNEFDKDIFREEMWKDMDLMDSLSNRLTESPVNKVKVLNSNTAEKQRSNMAEHIYAFKEHYTEVRPSMEEKRKNLNEVHTSAEKNHCTSRKRLKCQAAWLRRPSHRFDELEVECLVCAVEKFGTGRWRDIKEMYFSTFKLRTAADLKDKWKSLLHSAMRFSINRNFRTTIPADILKRVYSVHVKGH